MSKFNAAEAIDAMEYDFTAFDGGKGTIPEPSTKQVEDFFNGVRRLVKDLKKKVKDASGLDVEELASQTEEDLEGEELKEEAIAALEALDDTMLSDQQEAFADMIAAVASNQPSAQELKDLPYRVFSEFQKWFMGEIRPNQKAAGTNR